VAENSKTNQRRKPKQARSRATWEAIVEAAAQILERGGADALNTNDVAERAGVSIGTLYQYFPDKLAILLAASRRLLASDAASLAHRPRALLQALIAALEHLLGHGAGGALPGAGATRCSTSARVRPTARSTERQAIDLVHDWLAVLLPRPAPDLIPIRSRPRK
jgi:AcrR family transcriptional regulator